MKTLLLFLVPFSVFAQDKFKAEYERRYFIKIDGNTEQHRMMEEQFSKPVYIELLGDENQCSLKEYEKVKNSQGPAVTMQVMGMEKDLETYLDFTKNESLVSKELDGKLFLISSTIPKNDWKLTRETKKINGFDVKKAILEKNVIKHEVWYSTQIKSKCGPDEAIGLPGLVLEYTRTHIEKPDNYSTYKLTNLVLDNSLKYNKPTKGKVFTEQEYKDYRAEFDKRLSESIQQGIDRE
ncbi:GLPGLI family protein [Faecalibacter macacae]|uniref:GLPGLI family protein n=1 Tax=Faecalibacter macacae TaxID=1859289 RepID=A0A3L9MCU9_9FLAO|nr:GLPGLI family protein [Faecalibacter macacae]RLZ10493.1 GLPGLI family protein [Faecalibacter macacae]